jgi:hypothetical protein
MHDSNKIMVMSVLNRLITSQFRNRRIFYASRNKCLPNFQEKCSYEHLKTALPTSTSPFVKESEKEYSMKFYRIIKMTIDNFMNMGENSKIHKGNAVCGCSKGYQTYIWCTHPV